MHNVSRRVVIGAIALLATIGPRGLFAADAGTRVALRGHDPVSYFTQGRPEKGSSQFSASFDGATYWFASAEQRDRFVAEPDRYAPQFAGFCAMNVARGEKYEADPEAWVIADGKLYVFGAKEGVPIFRRQAPDIIADAKRHWPEVRGTP